MAANAALDEIRGAAGSGDCFAWTERTIIRTGQCVGERRSGRSAPLGRKLRQSGGAGQRPEQEWGGAHRASSVLRGAGRPQARLRAFPSTVQRDERVGRETAGATEGYRRPASGVA